MSKAKARLISPEISLSPRLAELGLKACLLFTWMVAHGDHQGRLGGNVKRLKAEVVPLLHEISEQDIEEALAGLEKVRLILRYDDPKHGPVIQVTDWWEWQSGLRLRLPSRYAPPKGWQDRVSEPSPRGESGRFIPAGTKTISDHHSSLKAEALDFLRCRKEASLVDLAFYLREQTNKTARLMESLCSEGLIEVLVGPDGVIAEPPFQDDALFSLSSLP